jgi:hypothetical protein
MPTPRAFSNYSGLIQALRARAEELAISRQDLDRLAGVPLGYSGKLLGSAQVRKLTAATLFYLLEALGLEIILIEDEAATARTLARRRPARHCRQHFGAQNNPPKELKKIALPEPKPEPVMFSHLRVIQSKRRNHYAAGL